MISEAALKMQGTLSLEHRPPSHKPAQTGGDDNHKMTCGTIKKSWAVDKKHVCRRFNVTIMTLQVEIVVEDVNDHAPQFPNPVWQLAFSEGSVPGTRYVRAR